MVKSKRYRAGVGKRRNRRYKKKLGPVVIYEKDNGIVRAFRNIPGQLTLIVLFKKQYCFSNDFSKSSTRQQT